jgi:hypothetical protein
VPRLITISVELFAKRFAAMTVGEVMEALFKIRKGAAYLPRE